MKETELEKKILKELKDYNLQDALLEIGRLSEYTFANPDNQSHIHSGFMYHNLEEGLGFNQESLAYLAKLLILSGANDLNPRFLSKEPEGKLKEILNKALELFYKKQASSLTAPENITHNSVDRYLTCFFLSFQEGQAKYQFQWSANRRHLIARQYLIFKNLPDSNHQKFQDNFSLSIKDFLKFVIFGTLANKEFLWRKNFFSTGCILYKDIELPEEFKKHSLTKDSIIKALLPFSLSYCEFKEKAREFDEINPLMVYPLIRPTRKFKNRYPIFLAPIYPYLRNMLLEEGVFHVLDRIYREDGQTREFRSNYGKAFELFIKDFFINIYGNDNVSEPSLEFSKNDKSKKNSKSGSKKADLKITRNEKIYIIEIKSLYLNYYFALKGAFEEGSIEEEITKLAEGIGQLYVEYKRTKEKEQAKKIIPILLIQDKTLNLINSINSNGNSILKNLISKEITEEEDFYFHILTLSYLEEYFNQLRDDRISLEKICFRGQSKTIFFPNDAEKQYPKRNTKTEDCNDYYDKTFSELMEY